MSDDDVDVTRPGDESPEGAGAESAGTGQVRPEPIAPTTDTTPIPGAPRPAGKKTEEPPLDLSQAQPTAKPPEGQKPKSEAKDKKKKVEKTQDSPQKPGKKSKEDASVSDVYVRNIIAMMEMGKEIGENIKEGRQQRRALKNQQSEAAKKENAKKLVKNTEELAGRSKQLHSAIQSLAEKKPENLTKGELRVTKQALDQQRDLNDKARADVESHSGLSDEQKQQAVSNLDAQTASLAQVGQDLARLEQRLAAAAPEAAPERAGPLFQDVQGDEEVAPAEAAQEEDAPEGAGPLFQDIQGDEEAAPAEAAQEEDAPEGAGPLFQDDEAVPAEAVQEEQGSEPAVPMAPPGDAVSPVSAFRAAARAIVAAAENPGRTDEQAPEALEPEQEEEHDLRQGPSR